MVGRDEPDAVDILRELDLDPYIVTAPPQDESVNAGTVVSMRPLPGREIRSGDVVVLVIAAPNPSPSPSPAAPAPPRPSPEPAGATMPDVRNIMLDTAVERLLRAGIEDIVNEEEDEPGMTQCLVYDQSPAPGTFVPAGATVILYSWIHLGECGTPV